MVSLLRMNVGQCIVLTSVVVQVCVLAATTQGRAQSEEIEKHIKA